MDLVKNKVLFSIVTAAFGLSILLTTFSFASDNAILSDKNKATQDKVIASNDEELSSASITNTDIQTLLAPEESAFKDKFMVNISETLNVRALADPNSEIVGKLYAGSGGEVLEKGTEWSKISSGNVVGYVSNQYIVFDEEAEAVANQVCPWVATVNTDTLRVRKDASLDSGTWGLVSTGQTFTVTSFLEGWITIDFEGNTGYLSLEYITVVQTIGKGITVAEELAAIQAEQERLAAIEAEKKRIQEEAQAKIQKAVAASQFVETVQTSPYNVSEYDAYLLACLVASEAGYENYDGKLAVANIVLNRLNGGSYGNTISSVIYAKGQFSVVSMGVLDQKLANGPNAESISAAKEALSGVNNVQSYTNFCSLKVANYGSYSSYTIIGNHVFYRK